MLIQVGITFYQKGKGAEIIYNIFGRGQVTWAMDETVQYFDGTTRPDRLANGSRIIPETDADVGGVLRNRQP